MQQLLEQDIHENPEDSIEAILPVTTTRRQKVSEHLANSALLESPLARQASEEQIQADVERGLADIDRHLKESITTEQQSAPGRHSVEVLGAAALSVDQVIDRATQQQYEGYDGTNYAGLDREHRRRSKEVSKEASSLLFTHQNESHVHNFTPGDELLRVYPYLPKDPSKPTKPRASARL